MRDKGIIESRLYEWADALRISGNEAAHGVNVTISSEDGKHNESSPTPYWSMYSLSKIDLSNSKNGEVIQRSPPNTRFTHHISNWTLANSLT